MSWLHKLFSLAEPEALPDEGRTPKQPNSVSTNQRITIKNFGNRIASVQDIDFTGQYTASPSGQFTLLWHGDTDVNGEYRVGRYVIVDDGRIVLDKKMLRPQDGKIADNGSFILNDWGSSDERAGTFHAFSVDGSEIIARQFTANLFNNGLSNDGKLAACQACHSPGSSDDSILVLFDLQMGREIDSWLPESGWADSYEFPEGAKRIKLIYRNREPVEYYFDGRFIDRCKWLRGEVALGNFHAIKTILKEGVDATGVSFEQLRDGANFAITAADERFQADVFRLLGEVEEHGGNFRAAITAYEKALLINSKIGVAKRVSKLRKSFSQS